MKQILNKAEISRIVDRIAYEIIEQCQPIEDVAILGIRTRGVSIAKRIRNKMESILKIDIPEGVIDITLYRDDLNNLKANPLVKETEIPFDINDKILILVDDVLYTGRTTRAALDQIMDFGRPKSVKLTVLIERKGRELPIRADFVGKNVSLLDEENKVVVNFEDIDGKDGVFLVEE